MSFFGGGAKNSQAVNPQAVAQAEGELDMIMDLFQRLGNACHTKCINKTYHESDLNKGESVCIDRCVGKYFATNVKIGEKLQQKMEQGQSMGMGM
ncbi:Tim10/DDP family zinc finger-domain-containing protein [Protomyces lactucae-debilis]|uniref:Mitochondrial import inner membrane translocase subunit n=1 Tax=Protomyces lactucae-debilis TaxID=2754530 RepID=A0A1Y2FQG6_PROLT|nr:Tim10/DDP family zinc finger-domain-containing protein [Protomyces lactucae-debilis]ORY84945.1 Tim10/DDP family zinc finger-domain-containing protein [Protomyces lactucae-debilis]